MNQDLLNQIGNFQSLTISLKTAQQQYLDLTEEANKKDEIIKKLKEQQKKKRRTQKHYSSNNTPKNSSSKNFKQFQFCKGFSCKHNLQLQKVLKAKKQKIRKIKCLKLQIEKLKRSEYETDSFSQSKSTNKEGSPLKFGFKNAMLRIQEDLKCQTIGSALRKIVELLDYQKRTKAFIKCMTDMVIKCAPSLYLDQSHPSLKSIWKWIKQTLRSYMIAKRQLISLKKKS